MEGVVEGVVEGEMRYGMCPLGWVGGQRSRAERRAEGSEACLDIKTKSLRKEREGGVISLWSLVCACSMQIVHDTPEADDTVSRNMTDTTRILAADTPPNLTKRKIARVAAGPGVCVYSCKRP